MTISETEEEKNSDTRLIKDPSWERLLTKITEWLQRTTTSSDDSKEYNDTRKIWIAAARDCEERIQAELPGTYKQLAELSQQEQV
jgi:hypothetical protein